MKIEVMPVIIKEHFEISETKFPLCVTEITQSPAEGASILITSILSTLLSPFLTANAEGFDCNFQG